MSYFYRLDTNVYYSNSRYIGLITNRHPAAQTGFGYNTTNRKARQFYQNYRAYMVEVGGIDLRCGGGRVAGKRAAGTFSYTAPVRFPNQCKTKHPA
jgi:hypothetical protein